VIGGGVAWWNGDNIWVGAGKGFVLGGIAGLTGGLAGEAVAGWIGGTAIANGAISGFVGGVVGDSAQQGAALFLGWRPCFSIPEVLASGAVGGVLGGAGGWWAQSRGATSAPEASVPIAKFRDYIFKEGATHGKDAVFRSLGYGVEHSEDLASIYSEQGGAKFATSEYTLGKLDQYGQRINIEIELPGIGEATGQTSYLRSGWMIQPEGGISLNTPFAGFTR
jgi:hypothetical protein